MLHLQGDSTSWVPGDDACMCQSLLVNRLFAVDADTQGIGSYVNVVMLRCVVLLSYSPNKEYNSRLSHPVFVGNDILRHGK